MPLCRREGLRGPSRIRRSPERPVSPPATDDMIVIISPGASVSSIVVDSWKVVHICEMTTGIEKIVNVTCRWWRLKRYGSELQEVIQR